MLVLADRLPASPSSEPTLRFVSSPEKVTDVPLGRMRAACPPREVEVADPYHNRSMRYFAMRFECILDLGFPDVGGAEGLRHLGVLLRALDGYTRPVSGAELLEPGAELAFGEPAFMEDAGARPRFTPIDRRQIDPAPFYLIWTGSNQSDPHLYPWPYQLAQIDLASFSQAFPRTVPTDMPDEDPSWQGYEIFQRACASCHAVNGEGGKVGPDLNVPMSIVEYRPITQIKAYIRDPSAVRYTSMPAHPGLTEADLDALIAYFRAMSQRKQDPRARKTETEKAS